MYFKVSIDCDLGYSQDTFPPKQENIRIAWDTLFSTSEFRCPKIMGQPVEEGIAQNIKTITPTETYRSPRVGPQECSCRCSWKSVMDPWLSGWAPHSGWTSVWKTTFLQHMFFSSMCVCVFPAQKQNLDTWYYGTVAEIFRWVRNNIGFFLLWGRSNK
jgi:hypothetical protein